MNAPRIKDLFDNMVRAGLHKAGERDLATVVETRFVNRNVRWRS